MYSRQRPTSQQDAVRTRQQVADMRQIRMRFDLVFLYQPVADLDRAAEFYEQTLGLREAWREGDDTRAFALPGQSVQLMVSTTAEPAGPMYQVDALDDWIESHGDVSQTIDAYDIPGGRVAGFRGPEGLDFYVFEMTEPSV
jgi:catechol 2,3-dioxygenase-like lactoylglutathione lyase family enzyme